MLHDHLFVLPEVACDARRQGPLHNEEDDTDVSYLDGGVNLVNIVCGSRLVRANDDASSNCHSQCAVAQHVHATQHPVQHVVSVECSLAASSSR